MNLIKLIKLICYNYKTRDDPLQAIIKSSTALYYTKQGKDELVADFALSTENRLAVYMTLGGTVLLKVGMNKHVVQDLYSKGYSKLDAIEKKNCKFD